MPKMKQKLIALFSAFIISINCVCFLPLSVYASGSLSGYDEWSQEDRFTYFSEHLVAIIAQVAGVIINPASADYHSLLNMFEDLSADRIVADNSESYKDYITKRLWLNTSGELVVDNELSDLIYQVTNEYIDSYTPYYSYSTMDYGSYLDELFQSKTQYNMFEHYLKQLERDEIALVCFNQQINGEYCVEYSVLKMDGLVQYKTAYKDRVDVYYDWKEWYYEKPYKKAINSDGKLLETYADFAFVPPNDKTENDLYEYSIIPTYAKLDYSYGTYGYYLCRYGTELHRIYSTFEDYQQYSIGERPFYITDKFQDYDINGDNSCILSESDLSNGSVYGDVYNYIINNYDNPDGLTEDELRDILDDYFNNSGGGSGSSGNDSGSGSSGNGLMDFLGGLGSIGDAILSILGKLMEYIGKALDLIGGTVTKVIDIIPKNITALLGALFPFFPEEWLTAIELGLVLAVIVGIVGLFKK